MFLISIEILLQDKKSLESVCLAFARLVDNVQKEKVSRDCSRYFFRFLLCIFSYVGFSIYFKVLTIEILRIFLVLYQYELIPH